MTSERKPLARRALLFASMACVLGAGAVFGFRTPRNLEALPKTGAVTVWVFFPDNTAAAGAAVVAGGMVHAADERGGVVLTGIPAMFGVVSAEAVRKEGGFLGLFRQEVRYEAFRTYDGKPESRIEIRLVLTRQERVERACRSCHPDHQAQERSMTRCVHKSGVPLKTIQVNQVRRFNEENEKARKSGKRGYPKIEPEFLKVGIFSEKQAILVCTSCHSRHISTGSRAYVLMPFEEKSVLCRGCHV
jgi:predicted CXXCH cytochrome family protein